MVRLKAFAALVFAAAAVANPSAVSADDITYAIEPYTLTNDTDEYIFSGTITTNGKLGLLTQADIMDYEIRVDGRIPYVFRPTPSSELYAFEGLNATEFAIEVMPVASKDLYTGLGIDDSVTLPDWDALPDCLECRMVVEWRFDYGFTEPGVAYSVADRADLILNKVSVFHAHDANRMGRLLDTPILVATVPEPSSIALLLLSVYALTVSVRRR